MLGKGLESLIPNNKKNSSNPNGQDYQYDDEFIEESDFLNISNNNYVRDDFLNYNIKEKYGNNNIHNSNFDFELDSENLGINIDIDSEHKQANSLNDEELIDDKILKENGNDYIKKELDKKEYNSNDFFENYNKFSNNISNNNLGGNLEKNNVKENSEPIFNIEVDKIYFNPYQPRKKFDKESLEELALSIKEHGILQPLIVTKIEKDTEFGREVKYQLIAGQRRLMAARMLGMSTVPVIIKSRLNKTDALEMAIVENIQRSDLSSIEIARAYARLSDEFGYTQREIAVKLGKSRESVANALRLLSLPSYIQDALKDGMLTESHARILLQVQDQLRQKELFDSIINEKISVRDVKRRANLILNKNKNNENKNFSDNADLHSIEKALSEFLGAPVNVYFSKKGGKIIIHFYSPEEAKGIIKKIKKEDEY